MTKKHFIALADAVKKHFGEKFTEDQINALADFCRSQNFNFNRGRWIDYINGRCGPSGGAVKGGGK